jgi:regulator of sigma E protease
MEIGQITAVQKSSPAAQAGIQAGDFIDQIDQHKIGGLPTEDLPNWDPVTLPEQLRRLADQGRSVQLTIRRATAANEGYQRTETLEAALRPVDWLETARVPGDPLAAPALGIAYQVLNRIDTVLPGSPVEQAGLRSGDVITKIEFIPPEKTAEASQPEPSEPFLLGQQGQHNWPAFFYAMQWMESGARIQLTYLRGEDSREVELEPVATSGAFLTERGFRFQAVRRLRVAHSLAEQVQWGLRETANSLGMVFRFLRKLGTQVPLTSLGGPVTIAKAAGYSAFEGVGKLLLFLTMLSANLAVINFLPIPLLDGGHMVFLAWEGMRGRPASERFVVALHTIGFVFIITLMLFVLALDLEIIPRNL